MDTDREHSAYQSRTGSACRLQDQCSRSVTFYYGSGFSDPYTAWITNPDLDPDPALVDSTVCSFQDASKKISFFSMFFCLYLSVGTFKSVLKDKKVIKKSQNTRNQGFLKCFLLVNGRESESVSIQKLRIQMVQNLT
jgi:hypothetical protein